ncbi:MAG: tripartite tricarboxylate transporter substrate-binding protein, partial [Alphaproteobacteria bacterium]|nr:tripartite tricarboxylate transporter substrate-binding protein [Alphaproteobacteria bacterium]
MLRRSFFAATMMPFAGSAFAQTWPSKPIRMIVPLAPGATADIIARIYADELGKALGQTIVVDNKTGAGGTIATAEASRAAPDGYTMILISQGTVVFNIGLYPKPGYDPTKDFDAVALAGSVSNVLVLHPDNPAKTVADVVAQAREKPGEYTYSSGGTGTSHHMSALLFERDTGVKMQHVPYRTTPAGIMGVANGEVKMGFFNTP